MCDEANIKSLSILLEILLKVKGFELVSPGELKEQSEKNYLQQISRINDISTKRKRLKISAVGNCSLPIICCDNNNSYFLLSGVESDQILIILPFEDEPTVISKEEFLSIWSGWVIEVTESRSPSFNFRWFIPEFIRYKKLLIKVIFFSLILQFLALFSPLFFQVVMDKVLVHNALSTLDVLAVVLVIVGIYEVILQALREYIFTHTTNRIDIRLGRKLFKHLIRLPLIYFKSRQIGSIVTRVQELHTIRDFLTGTALILMVDVAFSIVFFAVMAWLSPSLTLIVISSIPLYVFLAWVTGNRLHGAIGKQFQCSAKNTSFMTETVAGIQTLKSLVLEPVMQRRWEVQVKDFAEANLASQTINLLSNHGVQLLQKLSAALIIWVGAEQVMQLEMTIGQLVAFNMLFSHVNQPLAKLVDAWQQLIQTRVSVEALGDMLNTPCELVENKNIPSCNLKGTIQLSNVVFRYAPDANPVLNGINLSISAGQSVGIVGPSGSGKSTITRLIQKLYQPQQGNIEINGVPLNTIPTDYLRSHIGVVLQENYLFNMTVRENIALKNPATPFDEVIEAATLAGAHDFILKLPKGYDTILAEGGASLSGGQRQRVAIARALIGNPSILIFDEATSALDDESQEVIQKHMAQICKGRTVITIAHRLSTVKDCDCIVAIDSGQVVEQGRHDDLISTQGVYARLWQLQTELRQEKELV